MISEATNSAILKRVIIAFVAVAMTAVLAACDGGSAPPPARTTTTVGAEGGTANGPDGVQVVISAGALDRPTEIGISNDGSGAPEIGGIKPISKVVVVTPHGTEFAESVRISLPFSPADVAAGGQPVIIKSQPGGTWTALSSEVVGSTVSADISGFSYYAVGTCYTSRDVSVPGPDPLLACPTAHSLKLEVLDNSGVALPVSRNSNGVAIPVLTITEPAQLKLAFTYSRPPSGRLDHIFVVASGAVTPADWPRDKPLGGPNDTPFLAGYQTVLTFDANPSTVPNAYRNGGALVRFRASVTTQMDAFYFGCLCFKPASWTYEAEVPVRVIFTAPPAVTHTVGGTVSGLTGAGLVLRNNGTDNLSVAANAAAFTFPAPVNAGSAYNVTVFAQPAGRTCTVTNGSGTASTNVTNVAVTCVATVTYTIGGNVTGLTGSGLVLRNNGSDILSGLANGAFTFTAAINAGAPYSVSVSIHPAGQTCFVQNGSGTANANVSNVDVNCTSGSAKAWQGAALLETLDMGEALEPQVAFDANGNGVAIWQQVIAGAPHIFARRYLPSSGWGSAVQVTPTNPNVTVQYRSPQVAFNTNGNAMAVFSACNPNFCAIGTAQLSAATASWAMATQLVADGGSNPQPQIAIDTAGNTLVVWEERVGSSSRILARRYEAGTSSWQAPRVLSADIGGFGPQIAFDASGNAIAIWEMRDTANANAGFKIMSDRYVAGSGWNPQGLPTTIASGSAGISRRLAVNAAGTAMAVWEQNDGTANSIYSSRYSGGSWGAPTLVETSASYAFDASVSMDGNGNAVVVWIQTELDVPSVWARHYLGGAGGAAVRMDDMTLNVGYPAARMAMGTNGSAVAVWSQNGRIFERSFLPGTGWAALVQIDNAVPNPSSRLPQVAVDANGNAIAVWVQDGPLTPDIWANVFR